MHRERVSENVYWFQSEVYAQVTAGAVTGPQWAVMIDTFVLSLVMCVMREHTGAIWITILMHMAKNGLAFYLLFVNPQIVVQIKAAILPLL